MARRRPGKRGSSPRPQSLFLLVEDHQGDAELIQLALQKAGFDDRVVWVDSGEAALAYLEGRNPYADRRAYPIPRLMLLDLTLAKLSGFGVLKHQQNCREMNGAPTLVLTGSINPADVDRAFELGAKGYLIKPATFDELVQLLALKVNQLLHGEAPRRRIV